MSVVDTSTWKPFRVGDLFETHAIGKKVACPTGGAIAKARLLGGDTPRVTVSGVDNGIVGYFKDVNDANYRVYENCISVSFLGTVFYQKEPTSFDMKVHVLQRDDLNEERGLYLASIIRKTIANFDYATQLSSSMLPDVEIMLPATLDGEPDWAYMETYMQQVLDREEMFAEHLASLTAEAVADGHVIDTSAWKAFKIGDLFDVLLAKGDIQPNLVDDGDVPLVSAGTVDNGIVAMISDKGDGISEVFPAGCLTVSMFGTAFWQTETFYAVSHGRVNVLMPKCRVSDTVGLFLASAVNACFNGEYDYSTMCTRKRLLDATVTFPATSDGVPDWAYMEQYMEDVMAVEALFADELDRVYCA